MTETWAPPGRQRHPGEGKETPLQPPWTQVHTFASCRQDPVLGWGQLLTSSSCFDRNLLLKLFIFCLLGGRKHLGTCLCLADVASLSFTDVFPCSPFFPCLCPDTFCLCHSSPKVKKLRVGFDYLITMVTRMTFMPICAWQDAANLYFSANQENCYLCFSPHNLVPPLCRSWSCCTMQLPIKH